MSTKKLFKAYPWFVWLAALGLFLLQTGLYNLSHVIVANTSLINKAVYPVLPAVDDAIPFLKGFIFLYILSYPAWVWGGILVWKTNHSNYINFVLNFVLGATIGFFWLTFYPTYVDREAIGVYQSVSQPGFLNWLVKFVFDKDGATKGYNLLPSFHCMCGTVCFIWALGRKEIKWYYQVALATCGVLCVISTLFTKQHVFLDCVTGIGLALVIFVLLKIINPGKIICKKYEKLHPEGLKR